MMQTQKDIKNNTPDKLFIKLDTVGIYKDCNSQGINKMFLKSGSTWSFDSYDRYDNTCYITNNGGGLTFNVKLIDIILINTHDKNKVSKIQYLKQQNMWYDGDSMDDIKNTYKL